MAGSTSYRLPHYKDTKGLNTNVTFKVDGQNNRDMLITCWQRRNGHNDFTFQTLDLANTWWNIERSHRSWPLVLLASVERNVEEEQKRTRGNVTHTPIRTAQRMTATQWPLAATTGKPATKSFCSGLWSNNEALSGWTGLVLNKYTTLVDIPSLKSGLIQK